MTTPPPAAERTALYGLVLAGGHSVRMGMDKGALDYHGRPQAQRCYGILRAVCDKVYVSVHRDQLTAEPYAHLPCLRDRFEGLGPAGGLLTAQTEHPEAAWLVLACDMPYVDVDVIQMLLNAGDSSQIGTAFRATDGKPEPLCAVYEPQSASVLHKALARGERSLRRLLMTCGACIVDPPNAESLTRINTPEEYEAFPRAVRETWQPTR